MYWQIYGLWMALLYKCLKCPVSEDPTASNLEKGPKHCWIMNDITFTVYSDQCEKNWVGKSLSYW